MACSEDNAMECKYHPSILQNTLRKHLLEVIGQIETHKKYEFLNILSNSFSNILGCSKCKCILKENCSAFNCGHKYCEQCGLNLDKCTICKDGNVRTNIRNFSNILTVINEIKSDFNSDRVIYEMIRYLLMPQKFPYVAEVDAKMNTECTPNDSSIKDDVTARKSRKSALNGQKLNPPSASRNSRKKLKFNAESMNENTNLMNVLENDSENLFIETAKNRKKTSETRQSYLELQPTISEMNNDSISVVNTKRKRKNSDSGSCDQNVSKTKRFKKKNESDTSSVESIKNESKISRGGTTKLKTKLRASSSDLQNQGMFAGFNGQDLVESFNKLETLLNCFDAEHHVHKMRCAKKLCVNNDILSVTGEVKQENASGTSINSVLNKVSTIRELENNIKKKNTFTLERDADTEALDLDIWKHEDKYKKKKSLFKSVKERNKRDISIKGNLGNILNDQTIISKVQSPVKSTHDIIENTKNSETSELENKTSEKNINTPDKTAKSSLDFFKIHPKPVQKPVEVDEAENVQKSREILAEITEHQRNVNCGNSTEEQSNEIKTPLGNEKKNDVLCKGSSKLGLPLFPDTNVDIFSQQGDLCSSTPCVTSKKITKTYSRVKNNIFNKTPNGTFSDLSPITEIKEDNDVPKRVFSQVTPTPKDSTEIALKSSTSKDSPVGTPCKTPISIQAEIHDTPMNCTPNTEAIPKLVTSEKKNAPIVNTPFKTTSLKESCLNEVTPMDTDDVIEAVDKVMHNNSSDGEKQEKNVVTENAVFGSNIQRETKFKKVKQLKESINHKTGKTLAGLMKNFNKNSSKLSVEKVRGHGMTPAKTSCLNTSKESPSPNDTNRKSESNAVSTSVDKPLSIGYDGSLPTQKCCTQTKSVACQTTADLHLALLKQEFPHLFEKYSSATKDYSPSVYDTPSEQINEGCRIIAKTPDVPLLNASAKYTLVSSVSSSEKKLVDEQSFMNRSVIGNSSLDVISANKTTNISGYAPLSSDKETLKGRKKLSCRLNFETESKESVKDIETECNKLEENVTSTKMPDTDNDRPDEIDFNDIINEEKETGVLASVSDKNETLNVVNQQTVENIEKSFSVSDCNPSSPNDVTPRSAKKTDLSLDVIPDTENIVQLENDENKIVTDDEDDVDFVAGTPTSQPTRMLVNTLEKIRTPHNLLRKSLDVCLNEFTLNGNTTPNESSIQPLPDVSQYSVVKKQTAAEITPCNESPKKEEPEKISLELFSSSATMFTSLDRIQITTSGLKEPDVKIIMKFCEKFSATYLDKLTEKSTHLVVKTDQKNRTARTFKYLQAIVDHVRIVSMKWIQECLSKEKLLNEEKYIPLDSSGECGPLRTFHVIKGITPSPLSWLRDYCIYFTEPVPQECTLQQLQGIMRKAGAIIVNNLREFKEYPNHHHIIIVSDDDDHEDDCDMKVAGWLQSYEAVSVEFNWILEVIGRNKLMPFADFEVIEIPNEYLLRLKFPSEMLQSNEEDQSASD